MFAIQLAHLAGYKVVTTASPRNFQLCTSLGADAVFDVGVFFRHELLYQTILHTDRCIQYRDPDVVTKIKDVTSDSIHKALDAISEASSQTTAIQAFAPGSGKLVTVLSVAAEAQALREDVVIQSAQRPVEDRCG